MLFRSKSAWASATLERGSTAEGFADRDDVRIVGVDPLLIPGVRPHLLVLE